MKNRKIYRIAFAVTGIGSTVLALILAFTPLGNETGIDFKEHVVNMHSHSSQERIGPEKDNHGKRGGFLFLTVGAGLLLLVRRKKSAGTETDPKTETEPMDELASLYGQGSITRDEFLGRKSVLEEARK